MATVPALSSPRKNDPVRERLLSLRLGVPVHAFTRVDSTMDEAHRLAAEGAADGTLIWTAEQGRGRGRQGRVWHSPPGGLYLSIILRPQPIREPVSQLALVAGLACAEAVRMISGISPSIRWPNDLLIENRKLAGTLVEQRDGTIIVGTGMNVAPLETLLPESVSLTEAANRDFDLMDVLAALYQRFTVLYRRWEASGFSAIRETLIPWMGVFGKPVRVQLGAETLEGIASDLDETGALVIRMDSGLLRTITMGEVTLLR